MPACAPVSSPVSPKLPAGQLPGADVGVGLRDAAAERRASAPSASSATASFRTSGVFVTRTPRALQAAMSMAS